MRRTPLTRIMPLILSLVVSAQLLAQAPRSVTPSVGSTRGGEEVLIHGDFGLWPPGVRFGGVAAPVAERIGPTTIRVITPAHLPETVQIWLFDYDMWIDTGLTFTFVGGIPEEAYERVLLPIFTPPVAGANGSDFRSVLRVMNASDRPLSTYGLVGPCMFLCPTPPMMEFTLESGDEVGEGDLVPTGKPGGFLYVPRSRSGDIVMQLRAFDISREATNFGTEIPVVRDDEILQTPITLLGIPTDPRFRNTLRIYAVDESAFLIRIQTVCDPPNCDGTETLYEHSVYATAGTSIFDPAYVLFNEFPSGVGTVRVTITPLVPIVTPPALPVRFWAFVSVTNNDTQHITVISPQR